MHSLANLADVDPKLLSVALADQRAATIAIVIRYLPSERAPGIVGGLDRQKRHRVVRCLTNPSGVPTSDVLAGIHDGLHARIREIQSGGPARAARILAHCDRRLEWSLLQSLQQIDPDLSATIAQIGFAFDDIATIGQQRVKSLLRNNQLTTWAMAMKRCSGPLRRAIEVNLCPRAVELLRAEIEYLGVVTSEQIERAQQQIAAVARRLLALPVVESSGQKAICSRR